MEMDILTLLLLMIVVVLVVIVIQLRRGGTCKCPVDDKWLEDFKKWQEARDTWADEVQDWLDTATPCINKECFSDPDVEGVTPPKPPPCKFGSC